MIYAYEDTADSLHLLADWTADDLYKESMYVRHTCEEGSSIIKELLDKLAAYEDTGLEPDEIKEKIGFMSPVCVGCEGKTADGKRTEKCTYDEDFRKCLERSVHLSELAHAEEQDRLVILPCKVSDTIYVIHDGKIWDGEVYHISYSDYYGKITATAWVKQGISAAFEDFGKTVFLTREEAEAALMREEV